jgi:MscS family membrane protein
MDFFHTFNQATNLQIVVSIGLIVIWLITRRISSSLIRRYGNRHTLEEVRVLYIIKLINFGQTLLFLILISIVWNVSFQGLSVYFASLFAVIGVAFFASWSILSNVTASLILFFFFPYKLGSRVKILDGSEQVAGRVLDISLFSLSIEMDNGEVIFYPNNLAIQKPIIQLEDDSKNGPA